MNQLLQGDLADFFGCVFFVGKETAEQQVLLSAILHPVLGWKRFDRLNGVFLSSPSLLSPQISWVFS